MIAVPVMHWTGKGGADGSGVGKPEGLGISTDRQT